MHIFLSVCALFAIAFVIHVLIWKIRLPKSHTLALLAIFSSVILTWIAIAVVRQTPVCDLLHTVLFYGSMSLCYVITYSAIESDSPTLTVMGFLGNKGAGGASVEEITAFLASRPFIQTRLAALRQTSRLRQEGGRYFLVGRPSLPFRLILGFRKVYGAIEKGG